MYVSKLSLDGSQEKVREVGREPWPEKEASVNWSILGTALATDNSIVATQFLRLLFPYSQVQSELLSGGRGTSDGIWKNRCGNRH